MIGNDPYGIRHAVRPGYGEPEPLEPVSTRDPPQAVNRCLGCTIPITECAGNCGPEKCHKYIDEVRRLKGWE